MVRVDFIKNARRWGQLLTAGSLHRAVEELPAAATVRTPLDRAWAMASFMAVSAPAMDRTWPPGQRAQAHLAQACSAWICCSPQSLPDNGSFVDACAVEAPARVVAISPMTEAMVISERRMVEFRPFAGRPRWAAHGINDSARTRTRVCTCAQVGFLTTPRAARRAGRLPGSATMAVWG